MNEYDLVRLQHMLDSAQQAVMFANQKTRANLDTEQMLTFALIKAIEIIGEAAANVSKECQTELPQIPWRNIVGMRNRLIHAYFDINLDIVWQAIQSDLPPLIAELEQIISSDE